MNKRTIWLTYDLGVKGDYEKLYTWLDRNRAKECVGTAAVFSYECEGSIVKSLREDIARSVEVTKRTRMYAIYRDASTKKMKGFFVFGGRRAPQWTGFSDGSEGEADEEI